MRNRILCLCFIFSFFVISFSLENTIYINNDKIQDIQIKEIKAGFDLNKDFDLDLTLNSNSDSDSDSELECILIQVYDPDVDRVSYNYNVNNVDDLLLYIEEQCWQLGVNHSFALSLLCEENPTFFRIIEGKNSWSLMIDVFNAKSSLNLNKTRDYGLWQLNGKYLWGDFIPRYWHYKTNFNWENPYHNTYIAIRHIKWIYQTLDNHHNYKQFPNSIYWETALVYNAGLGRVLAKNIPNKTLNYASNIMARTRF